MEKKEEQGKYRVSVFNWFSIGTIITLLAGIFALGGWVVANDRDRADASYDRIRIRAEIDSRFERVLEAIGALRDAVSDLTKITAQSSVSISTNSQKIDANTNRIDRLERWQERFESRQ